MSATESDKPLPADPASDPAIDAAPDPAGGVGPPEQVPARQKSSSRTLVEWGAIVVVAVLAALLLRAFVVQPYYIPSGSMYPTLHVGDKVLVNKLSYDFHSIHRGDVVVFKKPANDDAPGITDLIKRVIGLPGDTISGQNGSVYIDGRKLAEPWLPPNDPTSTFGPVHVPKGDLFVMGDNRGNSADSRVIGPVPESLVVGRAFIRVWPLGRLGFL